MPPYRPTVALCARVSTSVWLFHLPAVTVDLGHYLESGVRLSVCVCGVCVCLWLYKSSIPWYSHIDENLIAVLWCSHVLGKEQQCGFTRADECWSGVHVRSESRRCVRGDRGSASSERGRRDGRSPVSASAAVLRRHKVTLCPPPPLSDSQCRRTECYSSFQLADAHKGFHCGLTVTVYAHAWLEWFAMWHIRTA